MKKTNIFKNLKPLHIGIFAGVGTIALTTIITLPLVLHNKKKDPFTNFSLETMKSYKNNGQGIANLLKSDYQELSNKLSQDKEALSLIDNFKSIKIEDMKNEDLVLEKIYSTNLQPKEKMFIMENYLEKLDIQEDYEKTKYYASEQIVAPTPPPAVASVTSNNGMKGFKYSKLEVTTGLPGWDINWDVGDRDLISGKYFSRLLGETPNKGWYDDDADERYESERVKIYFKNLQDNSEDYVSLYFNQAKDTDLANEDYTFVAIEPSNVNNIINDSEKAASGQVGPRVPSLFGVPLNIHSMMSTFEAFQHGLHADNDYMASFHEEDQGEDNEWGNYMLDVKNPDDTPAQGFEARDGLQSMRHFVKNFIDYVDSKLNVDWNGKLNKNYLYTKTSDSTWIYNTIDGHKIALDNLSHKDENYNAFADDVTVFHKTNQEIYNKDFRKWLELLEKDKQGNELWDFSKITTNNGFVIPVNTIAGMVFDGPFDKFLRDKIVNSQPISKEELGIIQTKHAALNVDTKSGVNWEDWIRRSGKTIIKFGSELIFSLAIDAISNPTEFAKSWPEHLLWNGFTTTMSMALSTATTLTFSSLGALVTPIGAIAGAAISAILNSLKTANGYTVTQNFGDHGLNDWQYQWDNNSNVMNDFEKDWSEDYTKGVNWRVTDGWFTFPTLDIQTNGDLNWTEVSKGSSDIFKNIGGNSFNYGHKVAFIPRSLHV